MIYGEIKELNQYRGISENLDRAIDYILSGKYKDGVPGKNEIDGDNLYFNYPNYPMTKELKDGTIKLNDEGISKITKTFKEDAPDAIDKIQETLNNGKKYNSFSGIDKNMSGNVKFILKVQEISNDK